ncbi:hypothetical protein ACFONN_05810 [Dyella humi]|uniref:Stability determinant domain-containing protein n=1 Tax=Dyella humi TaxID=1770547 RepID=A0ABW8IIM3_9GAMM
MHSNDGENALPVATDAYEAWFLHKVQEALADARPAHPHIRVMNEAQVLIDKKRRTNS